jgi:hypothetical protein
MSRQVPITSWVVCTRNMHCFLPRSTSRSNNHHSPTDLCLSHNITGSICSQQIVFGILHTSLMRRHEVQAVPILDPVSGQQVLLVLQTDITGRAELEARMAALTESQLQLLECLFPR